jgi:hypothetical protein
LKACAFQIHTTEVEVVLLPFREGRLDVEGEERYLEASRKARLVYHSWRVSGVTEFSVSVLVNVVTTSLILSQILIVARRMNRLGSTVGSFQFKSTLPYRHLLMLLLESSLPLTLLGVTGAVLTGLLDTKGQDNSQAIHAFPIFMVMWTNALVSADLSSFGAS